MKKIIAFMVLTTLSLSSNAASTKARFEILETKVAEIESILGDQQSYIGGTLIDLDQFAKANGFGLEVASSLNASLIKKYHAIL